jgi:protein-tyrosine phosphatase
VNYKQLNISDNPTTNIASHFSDAFKYIYEALSGEHTILVHCLGGKSRSVSIVIGYIMLTQKIGFEEAWVFVKGKRKQAEPNDGFKIQLKLLEKAINEYYKAVEGVKVTKGYDFDLLMKLIHEHVVDAMKNKDTKDVKIRNINEIKMK